MSDLDNIDHGAEHHATTGSDVCWCDNRIDPTDDAQITRLATAYIKAYHETPWLEFVSADDQVRECLRAALREVTATEATS